MNILNTPEMVTEKREGIKVTSILPPLAEERRCVHVESWAENGWHFHSPARCSGVVLTEPRCSDGELGNWSQDSESQVTAIITAFHFLHIKQAEFRTKINIPVGCD